MFLRGAHKGRLVEEAANADDRNYILTQPLYNEFFCPLLLIVVNSSFCGLIDLCSTQVASNKWLANSRMPNANLNAVQVKVGKLTCCLFFVALLLCLPQNSTEDINDLKIYWVKVLTFFFWFLFVS